MAGGELELPEAGSGELVEAQGRRWAWWWAAGWQLRALRLTQQLSRELQLVLEVRWGAALAAQLGLAQALMVLACVQHWH